MSVYFAFYCDAQQKAQESAARHPINILFFFIAAAYFLLLISQIYKSKKYSQRKKIIVYTLLILAGLLILPAYILVSLIRSPNLCNG